MKEIKAYIKPHKLSQVTLALHKIEGLSGMSVVDVRGFGRSRAGAWILSRTPCLTVGDLGP